MYIWVNDIFTFSFFFGLNFISTSESVKNKPFPWSGDSKLVMVWFEPFHILPPSPAAVQPRVLWHPSTPGVRSTPETCWRPTENRDLDGLWTAVHGLHQWDTSWASLQKVIWFGERLEPVQMAETRERHIWWPWNIRIVAVKWFLHTWREAQRHCWCMWQDEDRC